MKAKIHLPVSGRNNILVSVRDRLQKNTPICEFPENSRDEKLLVADLLKVEKAKIMKFLKVKLGDEITPGKVLAEKKNLFSSCTIRSPIGGKLKEIDLKDGSLVISGTDTGNRSADNQESGLSSPITDGIVTEVTTEYVEIEFPGTEYPLLSGIGNDVTGILHFLTMPEVSVLDFDANAANKIILCRSLSEDSMIKMDVIGVRGIIVKDFRTDTTYPMPAGEVSEQHFDSLTRHSGDEVWLRPSRKQLIVVH